MGNIGSHEDFTSGRRGPQANCRKGRILGYALWVTLKHLLKRRSAIVPQPPASGVDNI